MSEIKVGDKVEVVELDPVVDVGHFEVGDVLIVRKGRKRISYARWSHRKTLPI